MLPKQPERLQVGVSSLLIIFLIRIQSSLPGSVLEILPSPLPTTYYPRRPTVSTMCLGSVEVCTLDPKAHLANVKVLSDIWLVFVVYKGKDLPEVSSVATLKKLSVLQRVQRILAVQMKDAPESGEEPVVQFYAACLANNFSDDSPKPSWKFLARPNRSMSIAM